MYLQACASTPPFNFCLHGRLDESDGECSRRSWSSQCSISGRSAYRASYISKAPNGWGSCQWWSMDNRRVCWVVVLHRPGPQCPRSSPIARAMGQAARRCESTAAWYGARKATCRSCRTWSTRKEYQRMGSYDQSSRAGQSSTSKWSHSSRYFLAACTSKSPWGPSSEWSKSYFTLPASCEEGSAYAWSTTTSSLLFWYRASKDWFRSSTSTTCSTTTKGCSKCWASIGSDSDDSKSSTSSSIVSTSEVSFYGDEFRCQQACIGTTDSASSTEQASSMQGMSLCFTACRPSLCGSIGNSGVPSTKQTMSKRSSSRLHAYAPRDCVHADQLLWRW